MTSQQQAPGSRIGVIDAIRGFAILGILFANIQSWSGYKFIPYELIASLPYYSLDSLFNSLHLWVVDGKFYAIFSILFGVGFGIQFNKYEHNEQAFLNSYRRRLGFLLLFGILHALFWSGDILMLYALLAFVLVELRRIPVNFLLPLAIILLASFLLTQALHLALMEPSAVPQQLAHKNYPGMSPQQIIDVFGNGSWREVFILNLHNIYWRWVDFIPNGRITRVLGLFVLGFYLARAHYFTRHAHQFRLVLTYAIAGFALTWAAIEAGGNITYWATGSRDLFAKALVVGAQVVLGLLYMSLLASLYQSALLSRLLYPLSLIGRMAFTNYLMQSLIGVTLFYGVGLGYFGTMGLAQLWVLALCIYIGQVFASSLWLRYFKQGPLEWLWRCLIAGQWTTNRL